MTPGGSATGVIVRLDTVDSTQSVAFALAERGAADRTVVVADQQLAGRGRRGRTWRAPAGTSLLASIVVRPRLPQSLLSTLSLTTAVAVAEALRRVAKVDARLKWPNDVLVAGKKVAGILLEAEGATSIALETGQAPSRESVLAALLEEFDAWRARLEGEGFGPVREAWRRLSDTLGRRVTVDTVTGLAADLDTDGALLIDVAGTLTRVLAGVVSPGDAVGAIAPAS